MTDKFIKLAERTQLIQELRLHVISRHNENREIYFPDGCDVCDSYAQMLKGGPYAEEEEEE